MKRFKQYPKPYREAWAAHMVLRNLGFTPDQLFVHRNDPPDRNMCVVLKHLNKSFAINVGAVGDDWIERWTEVLNEANSRTPEDKELMHEYHTSNAFVEKAGLLSALLLKGINFPFQQD